MNSPKVDRFFESGSNDSTTNDFKGGAIFIQNPSQFYPNYFWSENVKMSISQEFRLEIIEKIPLKNGITNSFKIMYFSLFRYLTLLSNVTIIYHQYDTKKLNLNFEGFKKVLR